MNLTQPYTVEQLIHSDKAFELNIDNTPPPDVVANMEQYLIPGLNQVRKILGHDMTHSSGYRCLALNTAVGGSKTSAHMHGYAEDFWCPAFGSTLDVVNAIEAAMKRGEIKFDQLIEEHTWVHISFDPRFREQEETAHFVNGQATYTVGT